MEGFDIELRRVLVDIVFKIHRIIASAIKQIDRIPDGPGKENATEQALTVILYKLVGLYFEIYASIHLNDDVTPLHVNTFDAFMCSFDNNYIQKNFEATKELLRGSQSYQKLLSSNEELFNIILKASDESDTKAKKKISRDYKFKTETFDSITKFTLLANNTDELDAICKFIQSASKAKDVKNHRLRCMLLLNKLSKNPHRRFKK